MYQVLTHARKKKESRDRGERGRGKEMDLFLYCDCISLAFQERVSLGIQLKTDPSVYFGITSASG
jgi:hypothetical protein